jgi:Uma2 family endonuclease
MFTSTKALMPVDEYLRLTEQPYCEYGDGAVSPKALSAKLHAIIQRVLMTLLQSLGVQAFPELAVHISPTRYLVPDVCVAGDFPGPYPTEPVLLCCEILSPEDRLGAMLAKCEEYHAWASLIAGSSTPSNAPHGNIIRLRNLYVRRRLCARVSCR